LDVPQRRLLSLPHYRMSLKEKLQQDLKDSLRSGNSKKRMVVGGVMSAIKNRELEKRNKLAKALAGQAGMEVSKLEKQSKLNDEEVLEVVSSEVKKRKESIESFKSGGREDLAKNEKEELEILMTYMPEQISEDAVRDEVKKAIHQLVDSTGAKNVKDIGKVIGAVMAKIKGKADGQLVSRLAKEELSK